jgi:hypothetical protein
MAHLTTQRGKRLFSITVTLLLVACANALPVISTPRNNHFLTPMGLPSMRGQFFFHSQCILAHIFLNYPLYKGDTVLEGRTGHEARNGHDRKVGNEGRKNGDEAASGFIHRERNGDLVIAIPNVVRERYKIRFFDEEDHFLFEVRQIRDPMLIVEKYNFQHTGLFQYELYRENLLIERSTFLIRKD